MHAVSKVELNIQKNRPPKGIVQVMNVTEKQFAAMKLVVGDPDTTNIQTDERMIIL